MRNVHERRLPLTPAAAGALLDGLATPADRLWPAARWPAQRFDRPVAPGAAGGHGPVRYTVVAYEPGRRVVYAFSAPKGLEGGHRFEIEPAGAGAAVLRHVVDARATGAMRILWPLVWAPLHDALIEDAFDRAAGAPLRPLGRWVRCLRAAARTARRASASARARSTAPRPRAGTSRRP